MARTKGIAKKLPTIVKSIEYRDGVIAKMSDGTIQAIITLQTSKGIYDEFRDVVSNRAEGQAFIDLCLHKQWEENQPKKSSRTKGVPQKKMKEQNPEGPYAGYMKHPPTTCEHQAIDKDKIHWADVYFCAYKCTVRADCPCAEVLRGSLQHKIARGE